MPNLEEVENLYRSLQKKFLCDFPEEDSPCDLMPAVSEIKPQSTEGCDSREPDQPLAQSSEKTKLCHICNTYSIEVASRNWREQWDGNRPRMCRSAITHIFLNDSLCGPWQPIRGRIVYEHPTRHVIEVSFSSCFRTLTLKCLLYNRLFYCHPFIENQ